MTATRPDLLDELYERSAASFDDWELIKEIIDESIDLALNYRQSGHPGGSRSKVHMFVSLLLSGAMRWDIRRPWRPFADRFVLSAGHTVPLVYATLAVLNEVMRARAERDADAAFPGALRHPVGHHAVEADGGEQHRHPGEAGEQPHHEDALG